MYDRARDFKARDFRASPSATAIHIPRYRLLPGAFTIGIEVFYPLTSLPPLDIANASHLSNAGQYHM